MQGIVHFDTLTDSLPESLVYVPMGIRTCKGRPPYQISHLEWVRDVPLESRWRGHPEITDDTSACSYSRFGMKPSLGLRWSILLRPQKAARLQKWQQETSTPRVTRAKEKYETEHTKRRCWHTRIWTPRASRTVPRMGRSF